MIDPKNPPAFPAIGYYDEDGNECMEPTQGMPLRDYFAAHALTGMTTGYSPDGAELMARTAYQIADAMLEERARG